MGLVLVFLISFVVVVLLVGPEVLLHPGTAAVGANPASDFQIMTWSLEWWPWALTHGINPLHTNLLWPPTGFSTLWMTTIPVPALLATPVTLLAGPLVSYNVWMLLAAPLAAASAYLLCRELTARLFPSAAGGLLFGLSPYMLGHTLSQHLNLIFVFPLPLIALFCVRYLRGKTSGRRFVAIIALLLLVQLGSSLELFADLSLLVVLGLAVAVAFGGPRRHAFLRLSGLFVLAFAVLLPVLIPLGLLAFKNAHAGLPYAPANFAIDVANLVVPTPTLLTGALHTARSVTLHFVGNIGEQDGYVGLPLLALAVVVLAREWRRGAWLAGALLLSALLLSFGPVLTVAGHPVLTLPFALAHLPVFSDALPARLSIFSALCVSVLAALWFARTRRRWLRLGTAALVAAAMLPNFWPPAHLAGAWATTSRFGYATPKVPTGFVADPLWRSLVPQGSTVLVLPTGSQTAASFWQVESGMRFALAVPYTPFTPPAVATDPTIQGLVGNSLGATDGVRLAAARLRAYLLADHVAAVLVTPGAGTEWQSIVARATRAQPYLLGITRLYQVNSGLRPLVTRGDLHGWRRGGTVVQTWLAFNGQRARVRAYYRPAHARRGYTIALSSLAADADGIAVSLGPHGQAAVAFTEYQDGQVYLKVATRSPRAAHWHIVTLDQSTQAISSPKVAVLRGGTTAAVWVDQANPMSILRAATLGPSGKPTQVVTLDSAATITNVAFQVRGQTLTAAFGDAVAGEGRVLVASFAGGRWGQPVTVASGLWRASRVSFVPGSPLVVRWSLRMPYAGQALQQRVP